MARGRKPAVRYWQRKGGGYFATIRGEQVELALGPDDAPGGPTYLKALDQFAKSMALETGKGTNDYLVSALMNQYRLEIRKKKSADVVGTWEAMAASFATKHGKLPVGSLRPFHLTEWLAEQTQWNPTTQNHAGRLVLSAIGWAVKQGYVSSNPLAGKVDLPRPVVRGKESRLTPALCNLIIDTANEPFKLLLKILHATGARPAEVWKAEAFNYVDGTLIYPWNTRKGYVHKTAIKTRRDRVIYLTPELNVLVKGLVEKHPTGPIFRTKTGKAWNRPNIHEHWKRTISAPAVAVHLAQHGIDPSGLVPYCFRHTWISDWVDSGRSIHLCARLTGTSVAMIEKVYGHPDDSRMRAAYLEFMSR